MLQHPQIDPVALQIGPLANLPVVKDLVTDMSPFFEKWQEAKGVFAPSKTRADPIEAIRPSGWQC